RLAGAGREEADVAAAGLVLAGGLHGEPGVPGVQRRADGAYHVDLSWTPPRTDGTVTEYQVQLDGRAATSLVFGGNPPRENATYSFYLGPEAGVRHRVRIRAMLPDGTWGGFSAERTVTTGP
ncbi:fibronectin type III domain-containing protein, partial [Streptomyces nigra]